MFVEHTYTHKNSPNPGCDNGEFLELKMWIGTDRDSKGISFENWAYDDRLPENLLSRIEKGARSALHNHKFPSLKVVLIEYRWLETSSPEWLFEVAAETCVLEAIQKLEA